MNFLDKIKIKQTPAPELNHTSSSRGALAEQQALAFLQKKGLQLIARNYRTPGRGGGEIDLIMRDKDRTLVFIEVRMRKNEDYGGAGASITLVKRNRIIHAAQHFLQVHAQYTHAACRFDVVLIHCAKANSADTALQWLQAAFDA